MHVTTRQESIDIPHVEPGRLLPAKTLGLAMQKLRDLPSLSCFPILFALLAGCATAPPNLPDPLAAGWQGKPVCEKLHDDDRHRVLRCTFPPGVGHERHYHGPHFGYALAGGRMRLVSAEGTREVDLATGSSYTSDGVAWHEVLNVGDTTVVYLIVEPR